MWDIRENSKSASIARSIGATDKNQAAHCGQARWLYTSSMQMSDEELINSGTLHAQLLREISLADSLDKPINPKGRIYDGGGSHYDKEKGNCRPHWPLSKV